MPLVVGVPKETAPGERRVALAPDSAARLVRAGAEVRVESGAGRAAFFSDAEYEEAGARVADRNAAYDAEVVARVAAPATDELSLLRAGTVLIGFLRPLDAPQGVRRLAEAGLTALSMELVPRITRAQRMDALSAMATVAGYRAVVLAAERSPKLFPLLTTAAGTIRPAQVLILGAGVAGLQAIATARRLGAVVSAYDVRSAAAEQVESLGAKFVELALETGDAETAGGYARALDEQRQQRQTELLAPHIAAADVVITTAQIPGRAAPRLITAAAVRGMRPGSVIVDLAAPGGGNCELTLPGGSVDEDGVSILGPLNLPAEMPLHASQMYGRTVAAAIGEFVRDGRWAPDPEDDIFREMCVAQGGAVVNGRVRELLEAGVPR